MGFGNFMKSGVLEKVIKAAQAGTPVQESGTMNGVRYTLNAIPTMTKKDKDKEKTTNMKCGGKVHKMKKGGSVKLHRGDGICKKGKTRGRMR